MAARKTAQASLGHLVREQRAKLHLTQSELASRVGVSRSAISELESGRIEQPRASVFSRLAMALGLPAAALLAAAGYPASEMLLELEADELGVLAASLTRLAGNEREWLRSRLVELRDLLILRRGDTGPRRRATAARKRAARRAR